MGILELKDSCINDQVFRFIKYLIQWISKTAQTKKIHSHLIILSSSYYIISSNFSEKLRNHLKI